LAISNFVVLIHGRARVKSSTAGEQYLKLVRSTPNKFLCSIIHPLSVARHFDRWLGDSFIARQEMPHTNEEENTEIYCISPCYK